MPRRPGPTPQRPTPASSTPAEPLKALTAASMSYAGQDKARRQQGAVAVQKQAWQSESWRFFDGLVGEFAFAHTWVSNVCSRARLVVKERQPDGTLEPCGPDHPGTLALNELTNGQAGQGEFLRMTTLHLGVAAECYLVSREMRAADSPLYGVKAGQRMWEVVGTEEISENGGTWTLVVENGTNLVLGEKDTVIRVWMPNPKSRFKAWGLSKVALPILREIIGYDSHINAQIDSRLTGNGMLLFPAEMTLKTPQSYGTSVDITAADIITHTFVELASISKELRGTAEAQVPVVMTPPGEFIKNIQHIKFWTEFDDKVTTSREKSLVRLATTLDIPKEVVTGTGDMNRWGAWQVEESSIKVHVEPKLDVLAQIISTEYLREATGNDNLLVVADTAILRLRPNRSKEALELNDRGVLGNAATLRETGFNPEEDAMSDPEWVKWMLRRMILGSWSPEMIAAALKAMGIDIPMPEDLDPNLREARPTPSLADHPTRDVPEDSVSEGGGPDPADVALAASAIDTASCVAMLALRAVERAGARLRTVAKNKPDGTVPSHLVHTVVPVFADSVDDLVAHGWATAETFGMDEGQIVRAKKFTKYVLSQAEPFELGEAVAFIRGCRVP